MIDRLFEKITIQKNTAVEDQFGNHVNAWTDYYICHAYADTFIKDENDSVTTSDERGITFEVRYCSELKDVTSTGYKVVFHGENFNIESVDMMNWDRKSIRLKCRKEKR